MASAGEAGAQGRTGGMGKVLARWAPYGSPMEEEISPPLTLLRLCGLRLSKELNLSLCC